MKKIVLSSIFIIVILGLIGLTLINLSGCAQVVSQSDDTPVYPDTSPTPESPSIVEDGQTGGTFTSGGFSISIPSGTLPECLRAQPTVGPASVDPANILEEDETLVSTLYQFTSNATDNFISTSDAITVTIPFTASGIPPADQNNPLRVYAKVYDPDSGAAVPVIGQISGTNLILNLKGFAKNVVFSVEYNPYGTAEISDASLSGSALNTLGTSTVWQTNRWMCWYNPHLDKLRTAVAAILHKDKAALTNAEIKNQVQLLICNNAAKAGAIYKNAGFRQPNLAITVNPAVSGTTEPTFITFTIDGGSKFQPTNPSDGIEHFGFNFGALYINPARMTDSVNAALGTVYASVAHEMFHAIQNGYDLSFGKTIQGFQEGPAATYGVTLDKAAAVPQVRTANQSEIMLLSNFLGCENITFRGRTYSYAYANQDFFVYVARKHNSNSLAYLKDVYEKIKTDVDALVTGVPPKKWARTLPPRETLRNSLNSVFQTKFHSSLGDIYFDFIKNRAIEHNTESQLRTGEPAAGTLFEAIFNPDSVTKINVNPNDLLANAATGNFLIVSPFAAKVLTITPSATKVGGTDAYLSITSTVGSLGTNIKATVYRKGVKVADLTGKQKIAGWGVAADDVLTLLVANVDYDKNFNIAYRFGPGQANTLEASPIINGIGACPFSVSSVECAFTYEGNPVRYTHLPCLAAASNPTNPLAGDMFGITVYPAKVASTGEVTVNLGDPFDVFTSEANGKAAVLVYATQRLKNLDCHHTDPSLNSLPVAFEAISGSIHFSNYSSTAGNQFSGTFSCTIAGSQETNEHYGDTSVPVDQRASHKVGWTGTITGSFEAELSDYQATPESSSIFRVQRLDS
jgi:hypothetical protein